MSEEMVISDIEKTSKQIKAVIRSCPRYLQKHYDECERSCFVVSLCWNLQDEDADLAENLQKTLEGDKGG